MTTYLKPQPLYLQRRTSAPGVQLVPYVRAAVRQTVVNNARVYGPGVVTHDGGSLFEGTTYSDHPQWLTPEPRHLLVASEEYINRELTLLWGYYTWDTTTPCNWSHFIWTYLLRLAFTEPTPLLVSERVPERFLDWARAMGFTEFVKVKDGVRIGRLWVPGVLCHRDVNGAVSVLPSAVYALRQRLGVHKPPGIGRTRIYVERGPSSPWRRVLNEDELIAALTARGFECIRPETMTVGEQLTAMANAEVVVNPFGGASAMTMFAPEDCRVIELSFPGVAGVFAGSMWADVLGQTYERVDGVPGEQTGKLAIDRDFTVPVEEVLKCL